MGGGSKQTIGYRYFMRLHMVLCHGPVRSVNKIYVGKRRIGGPDSGGIGIETPVTANSTVLLNNIGLFGGDKKEGGIFGYLDVLLGGSTQVPNTALLSIYGANSPAFKGVTSLVFRKGPIGYDTKFLGPSQGGYLSAMTPYPKAWAGEVTSIPGGSFNPTKQEINPVEVETTGVFVSSANGGHIIYDALTNSDWGLGHPVSNLDLTSFTSATDTLYDESFGMSFMYSNQSTMEDFLEQVLTHINGVLYNSRSTGEFILKLIRDDFDVNTLPVFDEVNITSLNKFERPAFAELVNEVIIKYRRRGSLEDTAITVQDLASIQAQGGVISQTINFPGIDSDDIAARVAIRELKQSSTPLARVEFVANRTAWNVNPGDVIKFSWAAYGIVQLVVRVTAVDYGTLEDGQVRISGVEDVFGLPANSYITPVETQWQDEVATPDPATSTKVLESPYYYIQTTFTSAEADAVGENNGYVMALAESPGNAIFNIQLNTRISPADYAQVSDGTLSPTVALSGTLDRTTKTSIPIESFKGDIDSIRVGTFAILNNEVLRVDSVDVTNGLIDVGRGYLDTLPQSHTTGDVIYFAEDNNSFDPTSYLISDSVDVKQLTQSSIGILDLADAVTDNVSIVGRYNKPYGPGNVQINGNYFPASVQATILTVSWTHQDRTQQLAIGGDDWYEVSLGLQETDVVYNVRFYNDDTSTLLDEQNGLTGTTASFSPPGATGTNFNLRIELESSRNGIINFQPFIFVFDYTKPIEVRVLENADVRILENGDRRILE